MCNSDNSAVSAATMTLGMGSSPVYLLFFVLVNASSYSGDQHTGQAGLQEDADRSHHLASPRDLDSDGGA
jgi:hypothetical protein